MRVGAENLLSTWLKNFGNPPSREKAYICLEQAHMLKSPQCHTAMMMRLISTVAPPGPNASIRIWRTGWPVALLITASRSWMEKRKARRVKKPKTAEAPTAVRTPIGALRAAL